VWALDRSLQDSDVDEVARQFVARHCQHFDLPRWTLHEQVGVDGVLKDGAKVREGVVNRRRTQPNL
jgi:hypothetical protein